MCGCGRVWVRVLADKGAADGTLSQVGGVCVGVWVWVLADKGAADRTLSQVGGAHTVHGAGWVGRLQGGSTHHVLASLLAARRCASHTLPHQPTTTPTHTYTFTQLKRIARAIYSNPPVHGARLVAEVVGNEQMFDLWRGEMEEMAGRIKVRIGLACCCCALQAVRS